MPAKRKQALGWTPSILYIPQPDVDGLPPPAEYYGYLLRDEKCFADFHASPMVINDELFFTLGFPNWQGLTKGKKGPAGERKLEIPLTRQSRVEGGSVWTKDGKMDPALDWWEKEGFEVSLKEYEDPRTGEMTKERLHFLSVEVKLPKMEWTPPGYKKMNQSQKWILRDLDAAGRGATIRCLMLVAGKIHGRFEGLWDYLERWKRFIGEEKVPARDNAPACEEERDADDETAAAHAIDVALRVKASEDEKHDPGHEDEEEPDESAHQDQEERHDSGYEDEGEDEEEDEDESDDDEPQWVYKSPPRWNGRR